MKGLTGWKLWVFLAVSLGLAAVVFMFQSSGPSETEMPVGMGDVVSGEAIERMEEEGAGGPSLATDELPEFVDPLVGAPVESPSVEGTAPVESAAPVVEAPAESVPAESAPVEPAAPVVEAPAESVPAESAPVEGTAPIESAAPVEGMAPVEPAAPVVEAPEDVGLPVEAIQVVVEAMADEVGTGEGNGLEGPVSDEGRRIEFEVGGRETNESAADVAELEAALEAELEAARGEESESLAVASGVVDEGVDTAAVGREGRRVLALRVVVPRAREGEPVLRGSLGYRVPLVVRQDVPDQIKGGVYMPGHTTYVIARQGHWRIEQVGGDLAEVDVLPVEVGNAPVVVDERRRHLWGWLRQKFGRGERGDDGGTE